MKTSRDLMLLAALAFNNGKFDDAGALFASALSSDDAPELLDHLNKIGDANAEPLERESVSSAMSLSQIAKSLSAAIEEQVEDQPRSITAGASNDDEDEEDVDDEDSEDEESDDSEEESEDDEESVSTSSNVAKGSTVQRRTGERKLIISGINSPIKLKQ